jgi:hypothetical protein
MVSFDSKSLLVDLACNFILNILLGRWEVRKVLRVWLNNLLHEAIESWGITLRFQLLLNSRVAGDDGDGLAKGPGVLGFVDRQQLTVLSQVEGLVLLDDDYFLAGHYVSEEVVPFSRNLQSPTLTAS